MSRTEKILISELPSDAVWLRLRDKFKEFDVEAASEDENVYDLRDHEDIMDDEVFYWGRDGWSSGFWHARLYLERQPATKALLVYAERGENDDCMTLLTLRKLLLTFMHDCMDAREHDPEGLP